MSNVIAIDPSGEGTTGFCFLDTLTKKYRTKSISRNECKTKKDYWEEVLTEIEYAIDPDVKNFTVVENYILYAHKAAAQAFDTMETIRLCGVIEYTYSEDSDYNLQWQTASEVMKRWTKEILIRDGWLKANKRNMCFNPITNQHMVEHEIDALRHAIHFAKFKIKEIG